MSPCGRRSSWSATVALTVALLLSIDLAGSANANGDRATTSYLIRASATFQRLGAFRIDANPRYAGAIAAFGPASSCRLLGSRAEAVAVWRSLGLRVDLRTYGALPARRNGCTAPDAIWVNSIRITARRWHTSFGLRVGDSAARLRRLYPQALYDPRGGWPRPQSYWLATRRAACIGDCGSARFVTVPQLLAEVRRGKVVAFFFHVAAQGD